MTDAISLCSMLRRDNIVKWDMDETAKGGPFSEILDGNGTAVPNIVTIPNHTFIHKWIFSSIASTLPTKSHTS